MNKVGKFLQDYGVVLALIILVIIAGIWKGDVFFSAINLRNVINQSAAVGILAVGMTVVIMTGGIDLAVGSAVALAAALGFRFMNEQMAGGSPEGQVIWMTFGVIAISGAVIGLVNALLITVGRVAPFIATLAGLVAFRSLTKVVSGGGQIRGDSEIFQGFASNGLAIPGTALPNGDPVRLTWGIIIFVAIAIVFSIILTKTAYGRHVVAVGSNEQAARHSGINPRTVRAWAYGLIGVCVGLAGIVQAIRFGSVAPQQTGMFYELDAIAAVVIGGTSLAGGRGRIWGTVVGVMLLAVIQNLLVLLDVSSDWQDLVKGVIILVAVLIQRGQGSRS